MESGNPVNYKLTCCSDSFKKTLKIFLPCCWLARFIMWLCTMSLTLV